VDDRYQNFPPLSGRFWDLQPLIDWGDAGLEDRPAVGFSLLPRHRQAPLFENARAFVNARFAAGGCGGLVRRMTREEMRIVPIAREKVKFATVSEGGWKIATLSSPAVLYGMKSEVRRGGRFTLEMRYSLHNRLPLVRWQITVQNTGKTAVTIQNAMLFRVGPLKPRKQHGRLDFLPTRFRLFSLKRSPKTQSAYYNITQRFGSLRLHPLDTPPLAHHLFVAGQAGALESSLPREVALSHAAAALLFGSTENHSALLFALDASPAAELTPKVNADPLAPGLSLSLNTNFLLREGESLELPAITAFWLAPDEQYPDEVWRALEAAKG